MGKILSNWKPPHCVLKFHSSGQQFQSESTTHSTDQQFKWESTTRDSLIINGTSITTQGSKRTSNLVYEFITARVGIKTPCYCYESLPSSLPKPRIPIVTIHPESGFPRELHQTNPYRLNFKLEQSSIAIICRMPRAYPSFQDRSSFFRILAPHTSLQSLRKPKQIWALNRLSIRRPISSGYKLPWSSDYYGPTAILGAPNRRYATSAFSVHYARSGRKNKQRDRSTSLFSRGPTSVGPELCHLKFGPKPCMTPKVAWSNYKPTFSLQFQAHLHFYWTRTESPTASHVLEATTWDSAWAGSFNFSTKPNLPSTSLAKFGSYCPPGIKFKWSSRITILLVPLGSLIYITSNFNPRSHCHFNSIQAMLTCFISISSISWCCQG